MKRADKIKRDRKLTVRLSEQEYNKVVQSFKTTTKRKLSEYVRYVLLDKPVTVYTRDQSLDEIIHMFVALKGELSAIGNNFNQSVKKLHTLSQFSDMKAWVSTTEMQRQLFMEKVAEINLKMAQLSDKWLQE